MTDNEDKTDMASLACGISYLTNAPNIVDEIQEKFVNHKIDHTFSSIIRNDEIEKTRFDS